MTPKMLLLLFYLEEEAMKLMVDGNESEAAKFDMTVSILFNYKANFTI